MHQLLQPVCDSSVSLDMYPDEGDSLRPPSTTVGKGGASTKSGAGAQKAKANDSLQESVPNQDGEVSSGQSDLGAVRKEVDVHMSVKKYLTPALKGFSPKHLTEVDEALIQQSSLEGSGTNI